MLDLFNPDKSPHSFPQTAVSINKVLSYILKSICGSLFSGCEPF